MLLSMYFTKFSFLLNVLTSQFNGIFKIKDWDASLKIPSKEVILNVLNSKVLSLNGENALFPAEFALNEVTL